MAARKTFSAREIDWLKGNGVTAAVAKVNGADDAQIKREAENQVEKMDNIDWSAAMAVVRESYKATLNRLTAFAVAHKMTLGKTHKVDGTWEGGFLFCVVKPSQTHSNACLQCGGEMAERTVKKEGPNQGRKFKVCKAGCKGCFRWVA